MATEKTQFINTQDTLIKPNSYSTLRDIRHIIQPVPARYGVEFITNMDNIFENLIVHNNIIYNSFIINDIIYNNNSNGFNKQLIDIILKHISANIRQQKMHFREHNRKDKLYIVEFNNYFDSMIKLLTKLTGVCKHFIIHTTKLKWGENIIFNFGINTIVKTLCSDIIFNYALRRSITNKDDINRCNMFIRNFSLYCTDINLYDDFVKHIDNIIFNTCPVINYNISDRINMIYQFKSHFKHYIDAYYAFRYIFNEKNTFQLMKDHLLLQVKDIINNNTIEFVKQFIISYKSEIKTLNNHIDMSIILLSRQATNIDTFITLYSTLDDISKENITFNTMVINCMTNDINIFFNSTESITQLVSLINLSIINNIEPSMMHYIIGSKLKNKDEFIILLSQKLMERIIYTKINNTLELANLKMLKTVFSNETLYRYNIIMNDYTESIKFNDYMNTNLTIITTYDMWKFNYKIGHAEYIKDCGIFSHHVYCEQQKYLSENTNKKLIIYPHIGCINITIGCTSINVLPAHMFCLEQFNNYEQVYEYNSLFMSVKQQMMLYPDDIIIRIIDSLVIGNILICNNNTYNINPFLETNMDKIDIIKLFHTDTTEIIKSINTVLAYERIDIISAVINHIIKISQYTLNELYNTVKLNIKLFALDREMFDNTIKNMIKKDYITITELNIVMKINWLQ